MTRTLSPSLRAALVKLKTHYEPTCLECGKRATESEVATLKAYLDSKQPLGPLPARTEDDPA